MKSASVRLFLAAFALSSVGLVPLRSAPPAKDEAPLPAPMSVRTINPVYPLDLLLQGKSGWAEIHFTVEYSGHAILPNPLGSSDPLFAKALQAEIEGTEFMPPRRNGAPVLSSTQQRYSFSGEASLDPVAKQILAELRKPKPAIYTADQLDAKLTPIRKEDPSFPYAQRSDGLSGKAEIEVIIDKDGRPLFPRIVSATYDDFGWAAATAIKRWKFPSPMKGGQKVEARITVPFVFDFAKQAASW
jgi:TonB family protein